VVYKYFIEVKKNENNYKKKKKKKKIILIKKMLKYKDFGTFNNDC
jgi:hypothetical protein